MTHIGPPGDWTSHPSPGGLSLVLASASPRRRELLARLGLPFEIAAADVDESPRSGEAPHALAMRLAEAKSRHIAFIRPEGVVVAADTVVSLGRRLFGKPEDPDDARRMLFELAGRAHRVTTAVAVARGPHIRTGALSSRVWLKPWRPGEIDKYVASGDPLDKAGGYAIQNEAFRPVARLVGCRCNVVGLPLGLVAEMLELGDPTCPYGFERTRCLS